MRGGFPALQPEMTRSPRSSGTAFHGRRFAFLFFIAFPPSASHDVETLPLRVSYLCKPYSTAH
jgi:hypothetical protein